MSDDDKNWVKRKFKPVARAARWECTPYELRHFNASLLIKEGRLSNQEIATHLGGYMLNDLLRTYAHELAEYRGRNIDVQAEIEQVRASCMGRRAEREGTSLKPLDQVGLGPLVDVVLVHRLGCAVAFTGAQRKVGLTPYTVPQRNPRNF
jgi:hypothetical protein